MACFIFWSHGALAVNYVPIDLSALKNSDLSFLTGGSDYASVINGPSGVWMPPVGPVPFDVGAAGTNRMWVSECGIGGGSSCGDTLAISTNVTHAVGVYTLINTAWGVNAPSGTVTLSFSGGGTEVVTLVGGVDIRDHNQASWPNVVTSPNTVTVFDNGSRRLDRQFIPVLSSFSGQTLTGIGIQDIVPGHASDLLVTGVTVAAVPEPGEWVMMLGGIGLMGFIALRRAKAAKAA